jgi:hypothetical protein
MRFVHSFVRKLCGLGAVVLIALVSHALWAQDAQRSPANRGETDDAKPTGELVEPRREPTPSEVLERLMPREGVARPIVRPSDPAAPRPTQLASHALPPNAVVPVQPRLLPDGYRLVDRPGRLQREGDFWVFAFESRSTAVVEPPLRLLPNRLLEDMEISSAGGTQPVVFLVSGEVTQYHGVNYLLVQKMLIRPETGNFK